MKLRTLALVLPCTVLSLLACASTKDPSDAQGTAIPTSSWDTTLSLKVTSPTSTYIKNGACKASFTMHLEPDGAGLILTWGRDGDIHDGRLTTLDGAPYTLDQSATLPERSSDCGVYGMSLDELVLLGRDTNHDGRADSIEGTGKATGYFGAGAVTRVGFDVELHGTLDATEPSLRVERDPHNPLDEVVLSATEPVASSTQVTLMSATESHPLIGSPTNAFIEFRTSAIFPFGSSFSLSVVGNDLAGLGFAPAPDANLIVVADPGLFAEDGFESGPNAVLQGNASIVSSAGTLPAITGEHSLLVSPGSSATLHLARPEGTNRVRFSARVLWPDNSHTALGTSEFARNFAAEAGVIGGTTLSFATLGLGRVETGDTTFRYASDNQDVTLELVEAGADVAVRFRPPHLCFPHAELCSRDPTLLIDDVRIE